MLRLRTPRSPRTILRLDALFDFVVAAVLLAGPVDRLYDFFSLPGDTPAIVGRLLSLPLFAFAAVLWLASRNVRLEVPIALAAAIANGVTVPLILIWMLTGGSDMSPAGFVVAIVVSLVLAAFSSLELEIVRETGVRPRPRADRS